MISYLKSILRGVRQQGFQAGATALCVFSLLFSLAACDPASTNDNRAFKETDSQFRSQLPPKPHAGNYRIGVGDELAIKFYFAPELNDTIQVRPDGKISLMFAQDIQAAGLTPSELSKHIRYALRKNVRQPELVVTVRNPISQRVYISGEVGHSGAVQLQGGETVLQAISDAGGLIPTARADEVALVRTGRYHKQHVYTLNLAAAISGEDVAQNVPLQAGDIILVPPSDATDFDRWIDQHIRLATPLPGSFNFTNVYHNGTQ